MEFSRRSFLSGIGGACLLGVLGAFGAEERWVSYNTFFPKVRYMNGARPDSEEAKKAILEMEKVPDQYQRFFALRGVSVIFFNGKLTDNFEFIELRGKVPEGATGKTSWDLARGAYEPVTKKIFIGIEGEYNRLRTPVVHEYGHCFDSEVGSHFYGRSLSQLVRILEVVRKEPFSDDYFNMPEEYIANAFDLFYSSEDTRRDLRGNNLGIYDILMGVEKKVLSKGENNHMNSEGGVRRGRF